MSCLCCSKSVEAGVVEPTCEEQCEAGRRRSSITKPDTGEGGMRRDLSCLHVAKGAGFYVKFVKIG